MKKLDMHIKFFVQKHNGFRIRLNLPGGAEKENYSKIMQIILFTQSVLLSRQKSDS